MTHDDELRSRLSKIAEASTIGEMSLTEVQTRGCRRTRNRRVGTLMAASMLVLGAVVFVNEVPGDDGSFDVASIEADDVAADSASGVPDDAVQSEVFTEDAADQLAEELVLGEDLVYYGGNGAGPSQVLPWGDGFVSFSKGWIPSLPLRLKVDSRAELPPELNEADLLEFLTHVSGGDLDQLRWYTDNLVGTFQVMARISTDGETWTEVEDFSLPRGQYQFGLLSDGTHLVSVHRTYDRATGQIADLVVSVTTDLVNWMSWVLLSAPQLVPENTRITVGDTSVALGPDGWYVYVHQWNGATEEDNIGQGFVGTWDGDVRSATVPVASQDCCTVVGTTAGFLATTGHSNEEVGTIVERLFFSPDGRNWEPVTMPAGIDQSDPIVEVEDGVLLSAFLGAGLETWRGDSDGSNWEPVIVAETRGSFLWSEYGSMNGTAIVTAITDFDYTASGASSATITHDGYRITADTDDEDQVSVTVVAESSGATVESLEDSWGGEGSPSFLFNGITFLGVDGFEVFIPSEAFDPVSEAYGAARKANQDDPKYVLAATTNGIDWIVEPLPGQNYGFGFHTVTAINGGIVTIGQAEGWTAFPIG